MTSLDGHDPGLTAAIEALPERERQTELHGDQTAMPLGIGGAASYRRAMLADARHQHWLAENAGCLTFRHVLAEEVAEVWAAVALQAIEAIDAQEGRS